MKNNELLALLKEADPDYRIFLEEKITINRENFQRALASVYNLGPESPVGVIVEVTDLSTRLWRLLREYHV